MILLRIRNNINDVDLVTTTRVVNISVRESLLALKIAENKAPCVREMKKLTDKLVHNKPI